jgi:cell division protein FtsB
MKKTVICALVFLFLVLFVGVVRSYGEMLQMAGRVDKIQNRLETVQKENRSTEARLKAISDDPLYRERVLIEGGITKKGERIVRLAPK